MTEVFSLTILEARSPKSVPLGTDQGGGQRAPWRLQGSSIPCILPLVVTWIPRLWPYPSDLCLCGHSATISPFPSSFPGGSDGNESTHNARDPGSVPGSGRSPGEGNCNPLQYSCLGNPKDSGDWWSPVHGAARVGHDLVSRDAHHLLASPLSLFPSCRDTVDCI